MSSPARANPRFLEGYVRISIDVANLKSLVRTLRMGKDADFLRGVLFPGGNVDAPAHPERGHLRRPAADGDLLPPPPCCTTAAEAGAAAVSGGGLTLFEKLCDDAVMAYIGKRQVCRLRRGSPCGLSGRPGERIHRRCASS